VGNDDGPKFGTLRQVTIDSFTNRSFLDDGMKYRLGEFIEKKLFTQILMPRLRIN
jgi:hypothetical protein